MTSQQIKRKAFSNAIFPSGKKVRVGFYVVYASSFSAKPLIHRLLQDKRVDFEILVIAAPDTMRGSENMVDQISKVMLEYGGYDQINVKSAFCAKNEEFIDFSNEIDFACIVNPYESMTHTFCTTEYLTGRGVKCFFVHYTYLVTKFDKKVFLQEHFKKMWKVIITNPITYEELRLNGYDETNLAMVGYPKLDNVLFMPAISKPRKIVVLAPHHTFRYDELSISAFEIFSDIYLELPVRYPNVDFIFRPHPLWEYNLCNSLGWSVKKISDYISEIMKNKNVKHSEEADYIDLFNKSDALIHDCGSFVAEYLYTSKPCCFMFKDTSVYSSFNFIGKMCLDLHYHAYGVNQVYEFMNRVVIDGDDYLSATRSENALKYICINHGNASSKMVDLIIEENN